MYNPNYENLPSFKSYVARQHPEDRYPYSNSMDCACARWLKSEDRFVPEWLNDDKNCEMNKLAQGCSVGAENFIYGDDWTFGKLLDRINAKEKELA